MATDVDAALRELVREEVQAAVADALEDVTLATAPGNADPESWRSRVHRVHEDTRLSLGDVAEVLGCSERSVRRYASRTDGPALPLRDGPVGKVTTAGELCRWIEDCEQAERFRRRAAGGGR